MFCFVIQIYEKYLTLPNLFTKKYIKKGDNFCVPLNNIVLSIKILNDNISQLILVLRERIFPFDISVEVLSF